MKQTRQLVKNLLYGNLPNINTWLSGYPFTLKAEWCPLIAVYGIQESVEWKGNALIYRSTLEIEIRIGVDASNEINSNDRGKENEDFLNDTASIIKNILFKNPQIDNQTILKRVTPVQYRNNRDLMVREAVLTVTYEKINQAQ